MSFKKLIQENDGPWKKVLVTFFKQFMEFFFPKESAQIDWSYDYRPLKDEFPDQKGKRSCDLLFEVKLHNGEEQLIQLHLEVQAQQKEDFAFRMLHYNALIYNSYKKPILSTAVLIDDSPSWHPTTFIQNNPFTGECFLQFRFNTVKILDYKNQQEKLEKSDNVWALIIATQLNLIQAGKDQGLRYQYKMDLAKKLFTKGYAKKDIFELFEFLDWVIKLDFTHMKAFQEEIRKTATEESWFDWDPYYVSTFQQVAHQEGKEEGYQEGQIFLLERLLKKRFGEKSISYFPTVEKTPESSLDDLMDKILKAETIDDLLKE